MALIRCPECGKEISSNASKCIYCGYPLRAKNIKTKIGECSKDAIQLSNTVTDKILSTKNLDKIMILSASAILVIIMLLIFGVMSNRPIVRNIKIGMTKEQLVEAESESVEYKDVVFITDVKEFGQSADITCSFNDVNRVKSIMVSFNTKSYKDFYDIFFSITKQYGYPRYGNNGFSKESYYTQKFFWNANNNIISLFYVGEALGVDEPKVFAIIEDKSTEEDISENDNIVEVKFRNNKKCNTEGCSNNTLPWSDYCAQHGCDIIGCGYESIATVQNLRMCKVHRGMRNLDIIHP